MSIPRRWAGRGPARSRPPGDHAQYLCTSRFDSLDGLRTVSILLVTLHHSGDRLWLPLQGYLGVQVFFVISGFIITTLLVREEGSYGRVSLAGFYVRRAFRILPLYYLTLALYVAIMKVSRDDSLTAPFWANLSHYLTYTNDFAGDSAFVHTWSLAVEEKFYLIWPALAFTAVTLFRRRVLTAGVLFALFTVARLFPRSGAVAAIGYLGEYASIMGGCLLSLVLHRARGFAVLQRWARSPAQLLALPVLAVLWYWQGRGHSGWPVALFTLSLVSAFPLILLNGGVLRVLSWRPLVHLGTRSYAFYLFYPLTIRTADAVLSPGGTGRALVRAVLMVLIGGMASEIAHWTVERRMIATGRRLARRFSGHSAPAPGEVGIDRTAPRPGTQTDAGPGPRPTEIDLRDDSPARSRHV